MTSACRADWACSSYTIVLWSYIRAHPGCHKDKPTETWATKMEHPFMKPPTCFSTVSTFHDQLLDSPTFPWGIPRCWPPRPDLLKSLTVEITTMDAVIHYNQSVCFCAELWRFFLSQNLTHKSAFSRTAQAIPATMTHKFVWLQVSLTSVEWRRTSAWPLKRGFLLGVSIWAQSCSRNAQTGLSYQFFLQTDAEYLTLTEGI